MQIEIDQSGKIEQTEKKTVLAYVASNGNKRSIVIPASVKRKLQELYRRSGQPRLFVYQIFAVGVFFLIRRLKTQCSITIDVEYTRKDKMIESVITTLLTVHALPKHQISFQRIGNRPPIHYAAKDVFDGKVLADEVITLEKFSRISKKTDGRLRACLTTLVDVQAQSFFKHYTKSPSFVKRRKNK